MTAPHRAALVVLDPAEVLAALLAWATGNPDALDVELSHADTDHTLRVGHSHATICLVLRGGPLPEVAELAEPTRMSLDDVAALLGRPTGSAVVVRPRALHAVPAAAACPGGVCRNSRVVRDGTGLRGTCPRCTAYDVQVDPDTLLVLPHEPGQLLPPACEARVGEMIDITVTRPVREWHPTPEDPTPDD